MTTKIAVSNQKGGAGKTTTSINVAGALNQLGYDVLLIDLDPQGHATEGVGLEDEYDADVISFYDVLPDLDVIDETAQLIYEHSEMDVIPSHQDMINIEDALAGVPNRENRLNMALNKLDEYEYIVVDCPPNLGVLTDNALLACENVLIPAQTKTTSIRALELLFKQINALEAAFDTGIQEVGLVANEVGTDNEADEMMEWFEDVFEERAPVWEIRKRVALQRAWNAGGSIFEHEEDCDMEEVYLQIAESLEGIDGER
ncbi:MULTISPECIES: ParA family protein [unclassified Haladaptatus]|uniref:ParA family protein n=1 Tax=unclassified Haladaptatus TaxID=2622732 RepID=UPI00209C638C|nr:MULTISPECIES: ParA family protein [unclassified Haladaptatus]MCO8244889.1 ParA family protein [Haladaptatus sp. AB643]MCO8255598.1 ParA family protein [Haladaptatus sp. AB618]